MSTTKHTSGPFRPDMDEWEAQINALLDGELDESEAEALKAAAETDQALAAAIIEAYQLQRLVATLPVERAPDRLREKLRRIPSEQTSRAHIAARDAAPGGGLFGWLQPRWVGALAALPLVIALGVQLSSGPERPTDTELAQARQDLAVAFAYLAKASRVTEREIEQTIGAGMNDPVQETTVRTLAEQLDLNDPDSDEEQDT